MAKKIISSDIIDENVFKGITSDAEKLLLVSQELLKTYKEIGKSLSKEIKANPISNSTDVKNLEKQAEQVERITGNIKELEKTEKALQRQRLDEIRLQQAREKSVDNFTKKEEKAIALSKKELTTQAQLLKLKKDLANLEPTSAEFQKTAKAAGELQDKINDSKEAIKVFASESKAAQAKTLFGQVANDLADLDFAGAAGKAKQFAGIIKSISFAEVIGGIKNFGSALLSVGRALLANPFVLMATAIAALGIAIKNTFDAMDEGVVALQELDKELKKVSESTEGLRKVTQDLQVDIDVANGKLTKQQGENLKLNQKDLESYLDLIKEKKEASDKFIDEINKARETGEFLGMRNVEAETFLNRKQKQGLLEIEEEFNKKTIALQVKNSKEREKVNAEIAAKEREESAKEAKKKQEEADKLLQEALRKQAESRKKAILTQREISISILSDQISDEQILIEQRSNIYEETTAKILDSQSVFNSELKKLREVRFEDEKAALADNFNLQEQLLIDQAELAIIAANGEANETLKIQKQLAIDLENLQVQRHLKNKELNEKEAKDTIAIAQKERKQILGIINETSQQLFSEINKRKDAQIKAADEEVNEREKNINRQEALAEKGLNNTLEFEKQKQDEAKLERRKLAEEQEKRQKRQVFYQSLIASLEGAKTNGEAIAAIGKATAITTIAQGVAGFFKDGVENFKGKGTETSDSNLVAISRGESVITAKGTRNYAGLASAMNEGDVEKWISSNYKEDKKQTDPQILFALRNVEQAIKNQESININWDSHDARVEKFVKSGVRKTIRHVQNRPRI